jgi:chromosome segregation ATPase
VEIKLEGSTLVTGVNGSGKSTILDAMTYALTGNTQFNKAAKDRDRTVKAYVRGDTKSNGTMRYLRSGNVISYIAMEFWSPLEQEFLVTGVCIESPDEVSSPTSSWFVCRNTTLDDLNFAKVEGKTLYVTPRNRLLVHGKPMKASEFMGRDKGTEQVLRALGLRCEVGKYRSKLLKMMAFRPENNIDQFISECVLEPGTVNSLKELREQRDQFERIKKIYEDLRDGKAQLEIVEKKIQDYENKRRNLNIREMMLCYQDLRLKKKEQEEIQARLKAFEQKSISLKQQLEAAETRFEEARNRLSIAESNDVYRGMQSSIHVLETEIADLKRSMEKYEEETAKLLRLQKSLSEELSWLTEAYTQDTAERTLLQHLSETGASLEQKSSSLIGLLQCAEKKMTELQTDQVHLRDEKIHIAEEIAALEEKIKLLESNQLVFPKESTKAKQIIQKEFEKRGIHTDVRFFAELVQEIRDPSWRKAIETFLGRKRYFIIVDGKYCHTALEILQDRKLYTATVVITDKLPEQETTKGSAAEQLVIANQFARKYANYLLNGIHLCDSLEELHEYPKGGLMKNGMLAKSYAVSYMNIDQTELCLGQDAIELQKKAAYAQKKQKMEEQSICFSKLEQAAHKLMALKKVDFEVSDYHLEAPELLADTRTRKRQREENIEQIRNNPDFLAVLQEQENARKAYDEADKSRTKINKDQRSCEDAIQQEQNRRKENAGAIYQKQQEYEEIRMAHLELESAMLEEYEKAYAKKHEICVITVKTVVNLRNELDACVKELETAQLEYCKISEQDINKRGVGYISFYREEYRNLANVKIEEAHTRLEQQGKKLESAFMNDFVAEINEMIAEAKREIEAINRELKQIPFGQDTYKFRMEEKPDRMLFFRICKKLENYMNSPENYMNSTRDDEEMERDIQEFMEQILQEEDESEYTDYRKYFTYDMEISSRQGDSEVTADLSKKQGSASNGEKQTPYFIILAASLMQCYPRKNCCARLAFIDEAFSALSRERIEQMVKYLEENDFQVIYAAPPEKIGSIGQYIRSTVSLVVSGRYTHAVEGLVKFDEINR